MSASPASRSDPMYLDALIDSAVPTARADLIRWRRHLHEHPELSNRGLNSIAHHRCAPRLCAFGLCQSPSRLRASYSVGLDRSGRSHRCRPTLPGPHLMSRYGFRVLDGVCWFQSVAGGRSSSVYQACRGRSTQMGRTRTVCNLWRLRVCATSLPGRAEMFPPDTRGRRHEKHP